MVLCTLKKKKETSEVHKVHKVIDEHLYYIKFLSILLPDQKLNDKIITGEKFLSSN